MPPEVDISTLPFIETGLSYPTLVICSGGRGGIIADKARLFAPYAHTHLINPTIPIPLKDIQENVRYKKPSERLMADQIVKWLANETEGRPMANPTLDYLYGLESIDVSFRKDITRIALLKLRALFPYLLQAHRNQQDFVDLDIVSRDTGQLIKVPDYDLFVYQSHPGDDVDDQLDQFLDLFDSDYAMVGTAFVMIKGKIPVRTRQDITNFFILIYSLAHGLQTQVDHLPKLMDIQVQLPFFLSAFRIGLEAEEPVEALVKGKNIPGGVDWDDHRQEATVETWRFGSNQCYIALPSANYQQFIAGINDYHQGSWHLLRGYNPDYPQAYEEFTSIRRGMPPDKAYKELIDFLYAKH